MSLAVVRNIASPLALRSGQEIDDFEQELVGQFSLAMAAAGLDGRGGCRRMCCAHYCASSMHGAGMDLKTLQELLGHQWMATTSGYIHVRDDHVEQAWVTANRRLESRFG
ncbi:MAG TPA: tyrosine-type recombinase/integrase [Acidimicrobiales bacterium]|nr:tyrosine-type recombinase/integrase [Acidimicrobiales bacterium]